jgi:hypothetical protein
MRKDHQALATFHNPLHSRWSLPLTTTGPVFSSFAMSYMAAIENLFTSVPLRILVLAPLFAIPPRPAEIQNEETKRKTIQAKLKEQMANLLLIHDKKFKGSVSVSLLHSNETLLSSILFSAIDGLSS